jgi:hypothetical protein
MPNGLRFSLRLYVETGRCGLSKMPLAANRLVGLDLKKHELYSPPAFATR